MGTAFDRKDILRPTHELSRAEERAAHALMREQFQRRIAELEARGPVGPCMMCTAPLGSHSRLCDDCVLVQAGKRRTRWWCPDCEMHTPMGSLCSGCGTDY